jgi:hypothetical protein
LPVAELLESRPSAWPGRAHNVPLPAEAVNAPAAAA